MGRVTLLLVRSIQGFLDGTQYAKGRYAVRKNPVISYADIIFYYKKVKCSLKTATKWLFWLLNGTQYAWPNNGGTQYARPK